MMEPLIITSLNSEKCMSVLRKQLLWCFTSFIVITPLFNVNSLYANTQSKTLKEDKIMNEVLSIEQQNVMKTILAMTDAFHNGDIVNVMAAYEKNATVVFEPEKPVNDNVMIRQAFLEIFKIKPTFEYSGHEVFIQGDTAMHIAPWKMTAVAPDGTEIKNQGLSIAILKKQMDGRWLMVMDNPHGQFLMGAKTH